MFLYNFFRIILEIKKSEYPGGYSDVFCCRKRYSLESLAAQWIQGFAQLVFLFFCAFSIYFRTPILTKLIAKRHEERAMR